MQSADLNLLVALDALLAEESVTRAAERLALSPAAMSRTLARIRDALGDPVLVRAGRRLVPTPRALAMRAGVQATLASALGLLAPEAPTSPRLLRRRFVIRASDAVVPILGTRLLAHLAEHAPGIQLVFVGEGDEDVESLRTGEVDIDIGVQGMLGPELKQQRLFADRYVALIRKGGALARGKLTAARLAAARHISVSRRGRARGPLDDALAPLTREVHAVVASGLAAALMIAGDPRGDTVTMVPSSFARAIADSLPLAERASPVALPDVEIVQVWHPRLDADPAHIYVRRQIVGLTIKK